MPRIRWVKCKKCKEKIDLKTIEDKDIMWNHDDEVAHTKCITQEDIDNEEWITTDEMRYCCDNSDKIY